mmetsp:Transcript_20901/g.29824  ORF Transcript_20901/g.29824 Transcript_20901/m.29824 type:complete len:482 (+) Transcript_20901:45-1490(+)
MSQTASTKVVLQVYRSLLRASRPFSYPMPHAALLTSLLHRKGNLDYEESIRCLSAEVSDCSDEEIISHSQTTSDQGEMKLLSLHARDLTRSYRELKKNEISNAHVSKHSDPPHRILFSCLLHELMGGGESLTRFPCQLTKEDLTKLKSIIQREFRSGFSNGLHSCVSDQFPYRVRLQTSFMALRELNKKLCYALSRGLDMTSNGTSKKQFPFSINGISASPPSLYMRPGTFLLAHPLIHGFFSRTAIIIIDHTDESSPNASSAQGGTYGLIINKPATIRKRVHKTAADAAQATGFTTEIATVSDIFRGVIEPKFHAAFNDCTIRTGGPVHASVQMLYKCEPSVERSLQLGGRALPVVTPPLYPSAVPPSAANGSLESDEAIYFQGDFVRVARAVLEGNLSKHNVSFLVGATVWSAGQLQTEIERGWWMPCVAPPQMTLMGSLEGPSLWSSLMAGIGEEEAKLAHLFRDNISDENIDACDEF